MSLLRVAGFDPSLNNWGMSAGHYNIATGELILDSLAITQPNPLEGKQVRNNSNDLHRAEQLAEGAMSFLKGINVLFVEVPVGSQSARSMASYGICVGVLGALRAQGTQFIELTPSEIKLAGPGHKSASKKEMIEWAYNTHPHLPWPIETRKGVQRIIEGKAEHMADSIAAVHAGINSTQFKQLISLYK